jgi:uncharacterized protein involved in response to NO
MIRLDTRLLFSYAFRPFFLLAGLFAVLSVPAWGLHLGGGWAWPNDLPAPLRHGHEMVFGFAGAAIAGFLLTAVATWTQRPPVSGPPLLALCGAWISARLGAFLPGVFGHGLWAIASLLFWGGLLGLMAREVGAARNSRNYKVPVLLAALLGAELGFFLPDALEIREMALRLGLGLVVGMILLVGGRIIPSFTQNWLRLNRPALDTRLPAFDRFDGGAVAASGLFALGFVVWPEAAGTGLLGLAAALLQAFRLLRWRGWLAGAEPLLWVLHVGYAWIPVGLALLGASALLGRPGLWDGGLHALGYGAIGTLILGVAARVALGHTGRPLRAFPAMTLAFGLMTLGTGVRLFAPPGGPLLWIAVGLWCAAYLLFLLKYLPILLAPRLASPSD